MKTEGAPRLQILAGVNGAGKSTLYEQVFDQRQPFVNPDVIAHAIAPDNVNDAKVSLQAGREAIRQTNRLLADRRSFALETTLSSQQALKILARAKETGCGRKKQDLVSSCITLVCPIRKRPLIVWHRELRMEVMIFPATLWKDGMTKA